MPRPERLIRFASLTVAGVLAVTLAACGGEDSGEESPSPSVSTPAEATPSAPVTPTAPPSALSSIDAITVGADTSTEASVEGPWPFYIDQTASKVIVAGEGDTVPHGQAAIKLQYTGINASTGATFDSSWMRGTPATFSLGQVVPGFAKGLMGKRVGDRVLIVIPAVDGYGDTGSPQAGINPGDTLIFVVDILATELAGPSGEEVDPVAGLPVVSDNNGVPKITIGDAPQPTEVKTQPIVQGSGHALAAEDVLISHALCVRWDGSEFYNDYATAAVTDASSGGVHEAIWEALLGSQVGSRVLVVVPGEQAYPNGSTDPAIDPNTPVACVVDLLYADASGS